MMDSKTEITRGGEKITVTRKEFKTLQFLTEKPTSQRRRVALQFLSQPQEVFVYRPRAGAVFLLPNFIEKFIPPDCA
jgi:DNA-binding response OmpR family regulator